MSRKFIIFLIILLLASSLGFYLIDKQGDVFGSPPWQQNMDFENVSDVQLGPDNAYYLVDQSLKRLSKVSMDGQYEFHIHVNDHHDHESLYLIKDYVIDQQGYIYVLALVLDTQGTYLEAEEILRYTPNGKWQQKIFERKYELSEQVTRPGRVHEMSLRGGLLYFYEMSEKDLVEEQEIVLNSLNLGTKQLEEALRITLPPETFIASLNGTKLGEIYYSTKRAEILYIDHVGESQFVYSNRTSPLAESYPVDIGNDEEQNIYFIDVGRGEVNRLSAATNYQTIEHVLTNDQLKSFKEDLALQTAESIRMNEDGTILLGVQHSLIHLEAKTGRVIQVLDHAEYKPKDVFVRSIIWLAACFVIALLLYALKLLYVDFIRDSKWILLKQIIIFIPFIVLLLIIVSSVVYVQFLLEYDEEMKSKLKLLAHAGAENIDTERMERITEHEHFMNEDFRAIYERNHFLLKGNPDLNADALYSVIYRVDENKQVRILMLYSTTNGTLRPTPYLKPEYDQVIYEGRIVTVESHEVDGEWLYALGPIYKEDGTLIGMQEIGMSMHNYEEIQGHIYVNMAKLILFLIPFIALIFLVMSYVMQSSIRKLRTSVIDMAHGHWDARVQIRSKDEIGELGQQFNRMAAQLEEYVQSMQDVNASYYRFVPKAFLEYLGKKSIMEVQLGDQIEEEMVILVSTIRSFALLSEKMSPAESFDFINSFYKEVGPIIRKHEGMINTYLSPGVMALFPHKPKQALLNALEMRSRLEEVVTVEAEHQEIAQLDIGIGIHKGPLMLGVVGEQERLEGNVISDDVNVSLLLEKHTETLGAAILLTAPVYQDIPDINDFEHRYLGFIQFPELQEPIELYDVYAGDFEIVRDLKRKTKLRFEQGVAYYQDGRFYDARTAFIEVIKANEHDLAAKLYFGLCDAYYQQGVAQEWNGSLIIK